LHYFVFFCIFAKLKTETMKKLLISVMILSLVFASCDNDKNIEVTGVMLMPEIQTQVGLTTELVAIISPHGATNQGLTWTSTDTEIVTVDNGKVTAKAVGDALVVVTTVDGGYTDASRFVVFQSFLYGCNELTSGTNFFGGTAGSHIGSLGPLRPHTRTMWRIGDLVWSDVIVGCSRGTQQGNFTGFTQVGGGTYNADCRGNRSDANGGLYSWCAVMRFDSLFCGNLHSSMSTGWRIPTADDFAALDRAMRGSGTGQEWYVDASAVEQYTAEWGGIHFQGIVTHGSNATTAAGVTGVGRFSSFWSSTEYNASGAYFFHIGADGFVNPNETGIKSAGRSVRCVRNRRTDEY
jgi:uncharacterized protein (TIGR02145 family)